MEAQEKKMARDGDWYEQFWVFSSETIDVTIDGVSALRLLAELLDEGTLEREGDDLVGSIDTWFTLDTNDGHLIRRLEDVISTIAMESRDDDE